jgi:hypothetical protein
MRQLVLGMVLGSLLTGTVVGAGQFYDSKGNVKAPRGSQESFDYFRLRQAYLDAATIRQHMDKQQLENKAGRPCAK